MKNNASYLRESQKYMDRYVGARLKADDYANRFAYSAYEWRKPQDHAFNRHFMYDQGVSTLFIRKVIYATDQVKPKQRWTWELKIFCAVSSEQSSAET
ncbi:hypothetical protein TELCIR_18103 [Teladorsagia circumcincta]|uniref:Uncharacterized protein n=1 Tax=Teladorsagia circumcincta TaxID=45464 RepID=A0A2G9TR87_TELCI|nr:hypothetical protein TELCIR_18103 [Teladorsagia circumcincta]